MIKKNKQTKKQADMPVHVYCHTLLNRSCFPDFVKADVSPC